MTIEKFDRDKAQAHLDSHDDAVVLVRDGQGEIFVGCLSDDMFWAYWSEMRLCYLTDTPPLPEQTMLSSTPQTAEQPGTDPDGWIPWGGGECPVAEGTLVDVLYKDGEEQAGMLCLAVTITDIWRHRGREDDIIAYRLHRKPEDRLTQLERRVEALEQIVNGGK